LSAAERQAMLRLAYALNRVLEARKLSQADAAKVVVVTQPGICASSLQAAMSTVLACACERAYTSLASLS
jgi:hypothetical protein